MREEYQKINSQVRKVHCIIMFPLQCTCTGSHTIPTNSLIVHTLTHSFSSPSQLLYASDETPEQAAVNSSTADQMDPAEEEMFGSAQLSFTGVLQPKDMAGEPSEEAHANVHKLSTE